MAKKEGFNLQREEEESAAFHNTWFSDVAYFHFDGTVSKKKLCDFGQENIHATIVKEVTMEGK
jgi:hypothetical protein